jgi:hypothetical protein
MRERFGIVLLVAVAMAVAGCGGSNKTTGPGGGNNNGGGTATSYSQRTAVIDTAAKYFNALGDMPAEAKNQALEAFLATRPEFQAVGSNPGCAWARFTDGPYVFFDNEDTRDTITTGVVRYTSALADRGALPARGSGAGAGRTASPPSGGRAALEARCGMPSTKVAWLYTTSDPPEAPDQDWVAEAADCLNHVGYNAQIKRNAGLNDLINLPLCAVFALDTHGDWKDSEEKGKDEKVYCMWTGTPRTSDLDQRYEADLEQGRLCYYHRGGPWILGETCYGITAKGVAQWWHFSPNSFVYCNTCRGFSSPAMTSAILGAGASVYAAWTLRSMDGIGGATAAYVFDRLTGANLVESPLVPKENPPQRAFNYTALLGDMIKKHLGTWYDAKYNGQSLLQFASGGGDFGILAPSISYMDMDDEKKQLIINGLFGSEKGEVRINDVSATIKSWSSTQIKCEIPDNASNSAGPVQVIYKEHKSNTRYLTEWRGRVTYDARYNEAGGDATLTGQFTTTINMDLHFRSDVDSYRDQPGKAPIYRQYVMYDLAKDSKCNWTANGSLTRYADPALSQVLCAAVCPGFPSGSIDEGQRGAGDEFAGSGAWYPGSFKGVLDLAVSKYSAITMNVTTVGVPAVEHWDVIGNYYPGSLRNDVENPTYDLNTRDIQGIERSATANITVGNPLLLQVPVTVHYKRAILNAVPSTVPPDDNARLTARSLEVRVRMRGR